MIPSLEKRVALVAKNVIRDLQRAIQAIETETAKQAGTTNRKSCVMKSESGAIDLTYNSQISTSKNGLILADEVCTKALATNR
jgi:hypothetical protein